MQVKIGDHVFKAFYAKKSFFGNGDEPNPIIKTGKRAKIDYIIRTYKL